MDKNRDRCKVYWVYWSVLMMKKLFFFLLLLAGRGIGIVADLFQIFAGSDAFLLLIFADETGGMEIPHFGGNFRHRAACFSKKLFGILNFFMVETVFPV